MLGSPVFGFASVVFLFSHHYLSEQVQLLHKLQTKYSSIGGSMCLHSSELQTVITPDETNSSNENSSLFLCLEKNIFRKSYSMLGLGLQRASCQVTESARSLLSACTLTSRMASPRATKQHQAQNGNGTTVKQRRVNREKPIDLLDTHFVQHCAVLI